MYIVCLVDLYIGPGTFDGKLVSSCEYQGSKKKLPLIYIHFLYYINKYMGK
jgi:hypothetical protein